MKPALVAHLLLLEEFPHQFDSFLESSPAFIERYAKPAELVRQKSTGETHFQPPFADRVEHPDLARELQRMIESRQDGAGNQLYPASALRSRRKECDRVGRVATVPLKIMLYDSDVVKAEFISLSSQSETLIKINVSGLLLRSDVGEKIDTYFHKALSIPKE